MAAIAAAFGFKSVQQAQSQQALAPNPKLIQAPKPGEPPNPNTVCPPGYYYDPSLNLCLQDAPSGGCPPGYYFAPSIGTCVPITGPTLGGTFPGGVTSGGGGETVTVPGSESGGEGPITVNVNNAVTVADNSANNALHGVAQAVNSAIGQSVAAANTIAQNTSQAIQNQLSSLNNTLAASITDAQNGIADVINGINSDISTTLGGVGTAIGNSIFNSINPVTTALASIIGIISQQIGGLAGSIGDAVARVIPLIVAAVTGAINPVTAILGTIAGAIQQQVAGIVQLGSDVSGGFGSLDSTLGRILTSWESYNTGFVEAQTGYPDGGSLHKDLSSIWQALAGLVTTLESKVSFKLSDELTAPCPSTVIQTLLSTNFDSDSIQNTPWGPLLSGLAKLVILLLKTAPALRKVNDLVAQDVNIECPSDLLPPQLLAQAVQRGFINDTQAGQEAARGNLNLQRWQIVKDLALHQLSPNEVVEALFRGLITQGDYQTALQQQGFTQAQINVFQGLSFNLLSVNELANLVRRQTIAASDQAAALKSLHYDDTQIKALQSLTFTPATMNEAIAGSAASDALDGLGASGQANLAGIPEFIQSAAASEGLSVDATNARWFAHWETGAVNLWIDLYFRGVIPYSQLQAVFRRAYIPDPLHSSIVTASRPLIQFRTISRMVFLQLISPDQGKALLKQHGYSDADAELLITYAINSGKPSKGAVAKAQHAVSVGIAKEEYIDGSISEDQFFQVLIAHQYTPQGASTEIAVINAREAMLARKAAAQLVVDEYGAGLINEQAALAQLAALGLTVAELARYAHKIRAFRVKQAKLPTEAELLKMLKANIITPDTYKKTLEQAGYSTQWADAFYQLGAPAGGSAGPTAGPAASTP